MSHKTTIFQLIKEHEPEIEERDPQFHAYAILLAAITFKNDIRYICKELGYGRDEVTTAVKLLRRYHIVPFPGPHKGKCDPARIGKLLQGKEGSLYLALFVNVAMGHFKVNGLHLSDKEPTFEITPKGSAYVDKMPISKVETKKCPKKQPSAT